MEDAIVIYLNLPQYFEFALRGKLTFKLFSNIDDYIEVDNMVMDFQGSLAAIPPEWGMPTPYFIDGAHISTNVPDRGDFDISNYMDADSIVGFDFNSAIIDEEVVHGFFFIMPSEFIAENIKDLSVTLSELEITFKGDEEFDESLYTEDFQYLKLYQLSEIEPIFVGG